MRTVRDHLTVYLSGRCNFGCSYCRSRFAGRPVSRAALLAGLGAFLAAGRGPKKITFLGGEPLLHPGLLKAAVARIALAGNKVAQVQVFTNGALLTAGMAAFLASRGVKLVLSVDGAPAVNDACRRFASRKGSAFRAVLRAARISGCRAASMVVTPAGAAVLAGSVAALRAAGFSSIGWAPDLSARWDAKALQALAKGAEKAKQAYLRDLERGAEVYEIANIYEMLDAAGGAALPPCGNITLAPDGRFYPCDKLLSGGLAAALPFRVAADGSGSAKFFRLAAACGVSSSQAMCAVAPWALERFGGACAPGYIQGQAGARKIAAGWLRGLARAGLKYGAFRRAHGV